MHTNMRCITMMKITPTSIVMPSIIPALINIVSIFIELITGMFQYYITLDIL